MFLCVCVVFICFSFDEKSATVEGILKWKQLFWVFGCFVGLFFSFDENSATVDGFFEAETALLGVFLCVVLFFLF